MALIENDFPAPSRDEVVQKNDEKKMTINFWQDLSPRTAFIFGLISAIAVSNMIALVLVVNTLWHNGSR